jgi:ubiquitin C-terminal hydrolase
MNLPPGLQWDASEFMMTVLSQLHKETRMPYVKRTSLSIPLNDDQSKINLILSTAKLDWNHYLTCERVSPIMENFCFQLMCRYKCSTVLEDGTRCGGTDVAYEYHTYLMLKVHPRSLRNAVQDGPPNILQLIKIEFSK